MSVFQWLTLHSHNKRLVQVEPLSALLVQPVTLEKSRLCMLRVLGHTMDKQLQQLIEPNKKGEALFLS